MGCESCQGCGSRCEEQCDAHVPETPLPSPFPVVIFDGDCRFCRRWVRRYWNLKHEGIAWSSLENARSHFPDVPEENFRKSLHVIEPDGTIRTRAAACYRVLQLVGLRAWPLWFHEHVPLARRVGDAFYSLISRHRRAADRASSMLHGNVAAPATTLLARRVFLRLLGLVYLSAFLSAGWQLQGLVGSNGIRPVAERLSFIESALGTVPFNQLPTLLWFDAGDSALQAMWILGAIAAFLLVLGLAPMAMLLVCWTSYLSIVNSGDVFFNYQWDALLLETGFLAIFLAPVHWRLNAPGARRPSNAIRLMLLWLLARFMFTSGFVKLQSGDPTWWDCTALSYHYWTQPLPTWVAWYMAGASEWFQKFSCFLMFVIELGLPLLIFGPRVLRFVAFVGLVSLQLLIMATGNYGFFNLLTIVLCVLLLDDAQLLLLWPRKVRWKIRAGLVRLESTPRRMFNACIVVFVLSLSIPTCWSQLTSRPAMEDWRGAFAGYRLVNGYGLFRSMTTTRPELRIEASMDGVHWEPYVFTYKPGPLDRRPAFCLPNMPRLDWQLWFDGLYAEVLPQQPNIEGLMIMPDLLMALADNREPVVELIEQAPFADAGGPRYLRWHLDQYRFTTRGQRSSTGDWWARTPVYSSNVIRAEELLQAESR
ncbi:MAG: membrane protein [Phycisphaerae bacterium]|nr:membrane protein [Phycisphaerae bacterium]